MVDATPGGWTLGPVGMASQSTQQLTPQQLAAAKATTAAMSGAAWPSQQQNPAVNNQQNTMMQALMNFGGQNTPGAIPNYGQTSNAVGLGAGTGGLSFPMFGGTPNGT